MSNKRYPIILAAAAMTAAGASWAVDPMTAEDRSWITISGEVTSTSDDGFQLAYDSESIRVEMDDWDWYSEGRQLIEGQEVSVTGRIDDDLFEQRTIEASSVYVDRLNTYYYASSADEEDAYYPYGNAYYYGDFDTSKVILTGRVESINGREFMLDTGSRDVRVDTEQLSYNPLDQQGYQQVETGDRVRITGGVDNDLFGRREINATTLVTLSGDTSF